MKTKLFHSYILVLISTLTLQAQFSSQDFKDNTFQRYWDDFAGTSSTAFSLERYENWEIFGYAGLTTLFILSSDMEMHEEFGLERENKPIGVPRAMEQIGNLYDKPGPMYFTIGFGGLLYTTGKIFNDDKLVQTTGLMAKSIIITSIFTTALKVLIGRARPYVNKGSQDLKPFNFDLDPDYLSMPSGHTSTVFAMMTVIAKQYDSWYVKIPAYTFATSVAVQRMNDQKHWISDLLVGGTIGYLVADAVVRRNIYSSESLSIKPVINSSGVGLAFQF